MPERTRRLVATLALGAVLIGAPGLGLAGEPIAWDQAKASELAGQLSKASRKVYDELYREMETSAQGGGGGGYDYHALKDRLRLFKSESRHLASELKGGSGRDETHPIVERLVELLDDMIMHAKRVYLQQPLIDRIVTARAALDGLAPYYGIELPAPVVGQPSRPVIVE